MNDAVIAENADPEIPFALSSNPLKPEPAIFDIPSNDVAIEPNPPVIDVAIFAAKPPAAMAPDMAPPAPDTALASDPAPAVNAAPAFFTKSVVAPNPICAPAVTIPAICPGASFPVINPILVRPACACVKLAT